ncbi:hypothetical protein C8Q76DRAFT_796004 [Earliella scabrosa]|nr:hypothetical protein C8Q76DRAFT_796004 [Earliella scabrosa]
MPSDEPYIAFATEHGDVKFEEFRPDGTSRFAGARGKVVIAELLPETLPDVYGILVCKSDERRTVVLSAVLDGFAKFGCLEASRSVEITVYNETALGWVSRLSVEFESMVDWAECARILGEAKSRQAHQQRELQDQLNAVIVDQIQFDAPKAKTVDKASQTL